MKHDLLVFTDDDEIVHDFIDLPKTLIVSFDNESKSQYIRPITDYNIPLFISIGDLYEFYQNDFKFLYHTGIKSLFAPTVTPIVTQILYVYDIIDIILLCEKPKKIKIIINDSWLNQIFCDYINE